MMIGLKFESRPFIALYTFTYSYKMLGCNYNLGLNTCT